MNKGEECVVRIEKMLYGGMGLGRIEKSNKNSSSLRTSKNLSGQEQSICSSNSVFISNAVPNETVKVKITKVHKSYLEGEIINIEQKSEFRTEPVCRLSKICGSCDWLNIKYDEQLRQKEQIIKESFKKIAGLDVIVDGVIPSPKIMQYRCKVQLPYSTTTVSKRLLSGYYKKGSHELINIKYCPMQPEIISEINEFLKEEAQKLNITGYDEQKHKGLIRHVIYRISSDLSQILIIFVINSNVVDKKLKILSDILIKKYPCIIGVNVSFNTKKTNVIIGERIENIKGQDYYSEVLGNKKFKVSAESFFQVNPYCAELIFDKVKELIKDRVKNPVILDAYSGVSSFGIWISDISKEVTCIEEVKSASKDAIESIKMNNISNINIINGDASIEFEKLQKKGITFDVSITDPPRKGCSVESIEYLSKLTSRYIIYVSCNPSTLARDVKMLMERGFGIEYLQGIDMFPNTYHVETICLLSKTENVCLN